MWPTISNIGDEIAEKIKSYPTDLTKASGLTAWIRVFSGAVVDDYQGLIMQSNTNFKLLKAAGEGGSSIYGSAEQSGTLGVDWTGKPVNVSEGRFLRPSPVITSFNSKEGTDQISRTCDFSITCFSLEQLEYLQSYFMEPGYSVAVEWGWNTSNSYGGLVQTSKGQESILTDIAATTLNNKTISEKRKNAIGEYDIFLGFIIGSSISNEGENFKIDVKLRGTPSLPTYLQSHNRITKTPTDTNGAIDDAKSKGGYSPTELIISDVAKRRFRAMFNELPSFRQTVAVKALENSATINDYINFDKVITDSIDTFINKRGLFGFGRQDTIKVAAGDTGTVEIDREKLFSQNKYIRFELAIDILNKIGSLEEYKIGDKTVSFKLDISNSIIGAFPSMFSTKASKLIIPGEIPNFSVYFLNSAEVSQNSNGNLSDKIPKGFNGFNSFVKFVESEDLNQFELKEKQKYYGYLKNLFVNFDMFKSKIEQKNKTIREILLDILNEMSSACNGFWNFQIVESEFKKSNETATNELRERAPFVAAPQQQTFNSAGSGPFGVRQGVNVTSTLSNSTGLNLENGDIVITVIDENWIGENPNPDNIKTFQHNGTTSPFLNSTLNIDIPSQMANQIIAKRLGSDSQPDSANIKLGGLFNAQTDLFLPKSDTNATSNIIGTSEENVTDIVSSDNQQKLATAFAEKDKSIIREQLQSDGSIIYYGIPPGEQNSKVIKIKSKDGVITYSLNTRDVKDNEIRTLQNKVAAEIQSAAEGRLTAFLDKIDVVPIPLITAKITDIDETTIKSLINTKLFIYCYDDTDFFDKMRNHYFERKAGGLSHPLPIKYSFTILGNSGIRRGDTFNITGIPDKYAANGLFQVMEIEHSISDMKWETTVTGQYRQTQ